VTQLEPLMRRNFLEYASYVVMDRAIPDLRDGLKPVQRRILHTLFEMHDGRFHKVANVIGETMKLHPHGDAAIGDALVVLANKLYFIERQGNFGNLLTGHAAAAARYIECRLTPLALETLFKEPLTEFVPSYDGRAREPVSLPAKIPVLLMTGTEGIAVGMATRILPHNFKELLEAQIEMLQGKEVRVWPDFPQGGIADVSDYQDGRGKVMVRAKIERHGDKKLVVKELPFGVTTEALIASIEAAAQKGQVKISSVQDFTTERVEIEIHLSRGTYADEVLPQLFAYTDCEVTVSSNITAIHDGKPAEMTVTQVLGFLTDQLLDQIKRELEHEIAELQDKRHFMTLERLFIENRVYKSIEKAKTDEAVRKNVWDGMHEHALYFVRPMVEDDVDRLLRIAIRRISQFDIDRHKQDLDEIVAAIKDREKKLKNLKKTAIGWLEHLLETYGKQYPRRTRIKELETVDRRAVANQNIRLSYDPATGFFGSKVSGDAFQLDVSEYDRVLAICQDGTYRILAPADKVLMPARLLHCALFDPDKGAGFTVVYRDAEKTAFGKRIRIEKFITDKEYRLIKDEGGRIDLLLPEATDAKPGKVHLSFVPAKRQRVNEATFDLNQLEPTAASARGTRLAPKPVAKITRA
jgi:topoisomerase-4 subunit A